MSTPSDRVFIGLGSNQGNRLGFLRQAVREFGARSGTDVIAVSPVYETAAHTPALGEAQPDYLNAVLRLRTNLSPEALLDACQAIEAAAGRRRTRRWAPRTLDLDLLVYGSETRATEHLTLPHPRLAERRFVLRPLADLAPNLDVPAPFEMSVADLLVRCADAEPVRRTEHALR